MSNILTLIKFTNISFDILLISFDHGKIHGWYEAFLSSSEHFAGRLKDHETCKEQISGWPPLRGMFAASNIFEFINVYHTII